MMKRSSSRDLLLKFAGITSSLLAALCCGGIFIACTGNNPFDIYWKMVSETLGTSYGIGQVLFKATTFIFTGLSAAICFRTGLFNIGVEGQLITGAFCISLIGAVCGSLPSYLLVPVCLLAGMAGGMAWAAVPGFLKARFGAHEIINTMMMNYIAAALVSYLVNVVFAVPASVHTPPISAGANLPRLESIMYIFKGSPVNASFFLAIISCLFVYYFFSSTRQGYDFRVVGLNPAAALYAHIDVKRVYIIAMMCSGALAGLGGSNFVMGYKHYYEIGFSEGAGFIGIAVALVSNNHPLGIIIAAMLFGMLEYGGLTINTVVPKELVNILQAIIIIFVVVFARAFFRWSPLIEKRLFPRSAHG